MLAKRINRAVAHGLIAGAGIGLLIALPIAWIFGGIIKWTLIGTALGASITVNFFITWAVLRDEAASPHTCDHCGYDLTGLNGATCPECGHRRNADCGAGHGSGSGPEANSPHEPRARCAVHAREQRREI